MVDIFKTKGAGKVLLSKIQSRGLAGLTRISKWSCHLLAL